jgi:GNAT superfamily N-acetyltransferase
MNIERLRGEHAPAYRTLMLEAYAAHPDAFTSSAEERALLPLSWWEERLVADETAPSAVFGSFDGVALTGAAGILFESRVKLRHHASIFGMYVRPAARHRGAGRGLVNATLHLARSRGHVRIVTLSVTEGNTPAEALYTRCGFTRWGIEPLAVAVGPELLAKVHMWIDLENARM